MKLLMILWEPKRIDFFWFAIADRSLRSLRVPQAGSSSWILTGDRPMRMDGSSRPSSTLSEPPGTTWTTCWDSARRTTATGSGQRSERNRHGPQARQPGEGIDARNLQGAAPVGVPWEGLGSMPALHPGAGGGVRRPVPGAFVLLPRLFHDRRHPSSRWMNWVEETIADAETY